MSRTPSLGLLWVAAALVMGVASPAQAEPRPAYQRQMISLTTDDGSTAPAMVTTPAGGVNTAGPAIIHLHGGPGTGLIAAGGAKISSGLAVRGYTVISPVLRQGTDPIEMNFKQTDLDIKAAVDYLAAQGFRTIILTGSSLGSICATRYLVDTQDPRVKADVHFTPTADLYRTVPKAGEDPAVAAARAQTLKDLSLMANQNHGDDTVVTRQGRTHLAKVWLDLWGPASGGVNSELMSQIRQPTLLIWGDQDNYNTRAEIDRLVMKAQADRKLDLLVYPGANHILDPAREQILTDVTAWLTRLGYGPKARVETDVIDINVLDKHGQLSVTAPYIQPAMIFRPREGKAGGAAYVIVHDWNADALTGASTWLGPALAEAGATVIAINDQRGQYEQLASKVTVSDRAIGDYVAYAHKQGFAKVVLIGQGYGALRAAHYLTAPGALPVAGLIALSPIVDPAARMQQLLGAEAYARDVKFAADHLAAPTDLIQLVNDLPASPPFAGRVKLAMQPAAFLDTWGPDAPSLAKMLPSVRAPVLLMAGADQDPAAEPRLRQLAASTKTGSLKWHGAASDAAMSVEDRTSADLVAWVSASAP